MSKCKITGKVLSIQLGRDETQLVLLGNDSQILYNTAVPTPAGAVEDGMIRDLEAVRGMLKAAVNTPELKRVRQVVFSLCTSQVITDTITTPDLSMAKIEKLIQANVDMYFPVDMREYQLVWQPIGPAKKENGLKEIAIQLWAVPIAMVTGYYTVANACGLSVVAIDFCGNSIATAVGATFARPGKAAKEKKKLDLNAEITIGKKKKKQEEAPAEEEPVEEVRYTPDTDLHITLERDLLGMTFVQGGQVVMQRFVQCGGDPAYQFGELSMMLEYYRSMDCGRGSFITGIVSGTLSQDELLICDLADMLGIPLTNLTVNYAPQLMLCLGASRTTEDFGVPDLNNPSKARKHLETQLWQYALVLAGGVTLIVVLMFTLSARMVWKANISSLESTQRSLQIQAQKYAGYADNYKAYSNLYDNYSADWDLVFTQLRTYNDNLVRVMQELEDTLPKNSSVIKLEIAPDGLNVQFACETKEEAAALIMDLRELQYADLVAISSLQGGGGGAATSYGSGEGEEAPTEGSSNLSSADREKVIDCIISTTNEDKVWELQMSLTDPQAEAIEMAYGNNPSTRYTSLATLKEERNPSVSQRADAVYEMLTTNHYAIYHIMELLEEDLARSEPILTHLLMDDLMADENADILDAMVSGNIPSGAKAREYNERLTKLLIKTEERLNATEALMATDSDMERWNIYYVEVELNLAREEKIPYLDMEEVVDDLAAGSFNTSIPSLNSSLNALISNDVWSMLASLTGADQVPLPDDYTDDQLYTMVKDFYTNKTSGDTALDEMIKAYDSKGTSGNTQLDTVIKKYKDDTAQKPTEPDDESSLLDVYTDEEINQMLVDYLSTGTTGNMVVDMLLQDYIETGTTGFDDVDKAIDEKVDELVDKYSKTGTTGNKELDSLILMVSRGESTGNEKLDKFINDRLKEAMKDVGLDDDSLGQLIESLLGGGTGTGTGGGGGGQAQDTRIFFQATLMYNDELKAAELTRKGLFYDDKVEKVEVAE